MEVRSSKEVSSEKLNKIIDFRKWLNEVKRCDNVLHAEREKYKHIAKVNHDTSHCNNYTSEPSSCCAPNTNNNVTQTAALTSTTNMLSPPQTMPKTS